MKGSAQMKKVWPWLAIFAVLVAAAYQLHQQGRLWWCSCGRILLWAGNVWSADNSQHLFDPYSFTHVLHGFAFCGLVAWALPKLYWAWRLWLAVLIEAAWEVLENSDFIINRYREATAALGYLGDTVINSLGDILVCGLGFLLARQLGLKRSILIFILTEVLLLIWIRDSLLLNILMLIYPVQGVKDWQMGL